MKNRILAVLAALTFLFAGIRAFAADSINATNSVMTDLNNLISRINVKLKAGKNTETDLADNLQEFDAILAKNKGQDPAYLVQVLAAKSELYIKFLKDYEKGAQTLVQIQHDFPGTEAAKHAEAALPELQAMTRRAAVTSTNQVSGLSDLLSRINDKIHAGKDTEADLADNLQEFNDLIVKHKGEDSDALAQVLGAKAELYIKFLKDYEKGAQTLIQIQHDFPGTETAKRAEDALPGIQEMARKIAATSTNVIGGLNDLIGRINMKIKAGKDTEADLADNLQEFDALIVKHKGEDPADLAHVLVMKAELYEKVLEDYEKLLQVALQIQHDFPGTEAAKSFESAMPGLREQAEKSKIQNALAVQTVFPPFSETGIDGKPLSIADYKGKVVLIDFWATWCGPCRAEIPNVVNTYEKYHDKGFEVVGINLDKSDSKDSVLSFTKENKMTWPEYYDGQYWSNKLVLKYGVMGIPMTYLLDRDGKIIAKKIRGDELQTAVAKALLVK